VPGQDGAFRVANASGFYGDRSSAMAEQLAGADIDVLTGDYLAELTMFILARDRAKDATAGFARTFLPQLESILTDAADRGVKIVTNAGGANPAALAEKVRQLAARLGVAVRVAHVEGDDLLPRASELGLGAPLAAHAYLGGWGIAACLRAGADVVITGRVTDAALTTGPAAFHFGWSPTDWNALAGAVVAGHVLECGAQATGGNFAFFRELPTLDRPLGFPIAEIAADGSAVITKPSGTGGAVTLGTVSAQLLYELDGARYAGPDVTTRFDTVEISPAGPDRVRLSGTRGEPPPPTLKVGLHALGGFRNEITFVLTGLDIEEKARWVRAQLADYDAEWVLARTDHPDAGVQEEAAALLHCVVRSRDAEQVGRVFSNAAIELALASYPGFHVTAPPASGAPYSVFRSVFVDRSRVTMTAVLPDGSRLPLPAAGPTRAVAAAAAEPELSFPQIAGPTRRAPLGAIAGARSGDKGGSATLGVWARTDESYAWLAAFLDADRLRTLLPETSSLPVRRQLLPNLRAMNFVVDGLLGEGAGSHPRHDPQAKALGEWLRSRTVDIPAALL
jgi:hypothetical protein